VIKIQYNSRILKANLSWSPT